MPTFDVHYNDWLITREELATCYSTATLKKAIYRDQIVKVDNHFLFSRLGKWQPRVKELLFCGLEPEAWAKAEEEKAEALKKDLLHQAVEQAIAHDYIHYIYRYKSQDPEKCRKLAQSAAALSAISTFMAENKISTRAYTFIKDQLVPVINRFNVAYLPQNPNVLLYRYIRPHMFKKTPVTDIIKLPRAGNLNSAKFKADEQVESWMMYLCTLGENYSSTFIARTIRYNCELSGVRKPSESWVTHQLSERERKFVASGGRYNQGGRFALPYASYVPVANAPFAGTTWQMDGTRINMIPHVHDGRERYLYIIAVRDSHSGDILGVHFDHVEDRWGWIGALRSAVDNTGYLPFQIVLDRFPGHNTPEFQHVETMLKVYGTKVTYTSQATGKAQVERWFETLQSVFMTTSRYYYGEGIRSTRSWAHRSEDYLKKAKKQAREAGFDFVKAVHEALQVVEAYRNTPLNTYSKKNAKIDKSPAQIHAESEKPHTLTIERHEYARMFFPMRQTTLRSGLLRLEIDKEEVLYPVLAYDLVKKWTMERMEVRYNEDNMDEAYAFDTETGTLITPLERQNRIQVHGPDAKLGQLSHYKGLVRAIDNQRKAEIDRHREVAARHPLVMVGPRQIEAGEHELLLARGGKKAVTEASETRELDMGLENMTDEERMLIEKFGK